MKYSILALLMLTALSSVRAQSISLEPPNPVLSYEGGINDQITDTAFYIRNNTGNSLIIMVAFKGFGVRHDTLFNKFSRIIPANSAVPYVFSKSLGSITDSAIIKGSVIIIFEVDTLTVPVSMLRKPYITCSKYTQSVAFTKVKVGSTVCQTFYSRNTTSGPISIYGIDFYPQDNFTVNHKNSYPIVLLPGEEMEMFDICYKAVKENEYGSLVVAPNVSSYSGDHPDRIVFNVQTIVDSILLRPCIESSLNNIVLGPVLIGGDLDTTFTLTSNRYEDQIITSFPFINGDSNSFTIVGTQLPYTLKPLEQKQFTLRFSPRDTVPVVKYRYAAKMRVDGPDCFKFNADLIGLAILPTADNIATPLMPDKEYVLGMSGSGQSFTRDFHFVNNSSVNVKIVGVGFKNPTSEFSITNIQPSNNLPFTLAPTEKMTVSVQFTSPRPKSVFFNTLVITTENGIQSIEYPIQAVQLGQSSDVRFVTGSSDDVSITPNPARDELTIASDYIVESVEVFDVLGRSIKSDQPNSTRWSWRVSDERLNSGIYYIRSIIRTPDGSHGITKPVAIER